MTMQGMYVGENENDKFWLSSMNGLKNWNVEDILMASVDGFTSYPQTISCISASRNLVVYHPSDQEFYKAHFLQRHQKADG